MWETFRLLSILIYKFNIVIIFKIFYRFVIRRWRVFSVCCRHWYRYHLRHWLWSIWVWIWPTVVCKLANRRRTLSRCCCSPSRWRIQSLLATFHRGDFSVSGSRCETPNCARTPCQHHHHAVCLSSTRQQWHRRQRSSRSTESRSDTSRNDGGASDEPAAVGAVLTWYPVVGSGDLKKQIKHFNFI